MYLKFNLINDNNIYKQNILKSFTKLYVINIIWYYLNLHLNFSQINLTEM